MQGLETTQNAAIEQKANSFISELKTILGLKEFAEIEKFADSENKALWKNAALEIEPHIQGVMPTAINNAFPYEGSDVLAYRQKVYNSTTAPLLQKAIIGVKSRVLEKISYEASETVLEYLKTVKFEGGFNFDGFMREFYYPMRVKDPNAILAIQQTPTDDRTAAPILKLVIHPSANIVYQSNDLVIVRMPAHKDNAAAYYCYAKNAQALVYLTDKKETVVVFSENDNNALPVCFLGGRSTNRTLTTQNGYYPNIGIAQPNAPTVEKYFYSSDFSYAVPLMNKCETLSSQKNISTLRSAIPVVVQRELKCGTCNGEGFILEKDEYGQILFLPDSTNPIRKTCPTCNGAGSLTPLKTNEINIPHNVDAFGQDTGAGIADISKNLIGYVAPDVANAKFISDETREAQKEVQDALNLDYNNLNYAQSAESKREARTEKETLLREIANSVKRVYEQLLKSFTLFLSYKTSETLRAEMLAKIKVILPTQFITIGVDELEKTYLENKANLSIQERDAKQRQIAKNDNPTQTDKIDLYYSAAWRATNGFWLYSAVELNEISLLGSLTNEDKVRATKAAAYIYEQVFIFGAMDMEGILRQTDVFIQAELAKTQALNLPPLDSTDSTQP